MFIDNIDMILVLMLIGAIIFIAGYITGYRDITTIPRGNETINMVKLHNGQFKTETYSKQTYGSKIFTGYKSRDIAV